MEIIIWIVAFAITITVHEAAHAWMADKLGDPTARLDGRLTLNPIKHYDPIGTTLLLVLVIARAFGIPVIPFGWAKPVRIDPYNFKNPQKDSALVSLAGPLTNFVLASILAIVVRIFPSDLVFNIFYPVVLLNIALGVFNLIPIHPLDGGKVLVGLLPPREARPIDQFLNRYGIILLFLLILPTFGGDSIISVIVNPIISVIIRILIPGSSLI